MRKDNRTETKRQRWTKTEWREIERRAALQGVCPSDFIRWAALRPGLDLTQHLGASDASFAKVVD